MPMSPSATGPTFGLTERLLGSWSRRSSEGADLEAAGLDRPVARCRLPEPDGPTLVCTPRLLQVDATASPRPFDHNTWMPASDGPRSLPTLRGPRVVLRSGRPEDAPAMRAVFDAPEVARWWPDATDDDIAEQLENRDPDVDVWLVEADGRVVGLIQAAEETDPMYRHAGIDIVLHPDAHGRGLGPEAIRVLARHLLDDRGHHRLVIDPNAANTRAIRAYEKVGFRRVGVLRQYEWHERHGGWTDGLLMDLLRDELLDG
jgi:aminoglycoside 6'-N-acetyltransferase